MTSFVFRIDEIKESTNANGEVLIDNHGNWQPSTEPGSNIRKGGGVSGIYYHCDGENISQLAGFPSGAVHYKTYSMYFVGGAGFWVLKGDATKPSNSENWHPLRFEWDETNYSSYLTNAGEHPTLRTQRNDQAWTRMLLPDIYHATQSGTENPDYGWLRGELPILLALIAFSMPATWLPTLLSSMFRNRQWQTHNYQNGREHLRGVVVYVYTMRPFGKDLKQLENGEFGPYYY